MAGEKILIIDDRRENLLFLANSVLRPEGYEVITAMERAKIDPTRRAETLSLAEWGQLAEAIQQ